MNVFLVLKFFLLNFQLNLQNTQKYFRICVTVKRLRRLNTSPIEPKANALIKRTRYGRLDKKPAAANLKPKTYKLKSKNKSYDFKEKF